MVVVTLTEDPYLSIPVNKIEFIRFSEILNARSLMTISAGGKLHSVDFDGVIEGYEMYNKILKMIEVL